MIDRAGSAVSADASSRKRVAHRRRAAGQCAVERDSRPGDHDDVRELEELRQRRHVGKPRNASAPTMSASPREGVRLAALRGFPPCSCGLGAGSRACPLRARMIGDRSSTMASRWIAGATGAARCGGSLAGMKRTAARSSAVRTSRASSRWPQCRDRTYRRKCRGRAHAQGIVAPTRSASRPAPDERGRSPRARTAIPVRRGMRSPRASIRGRIALRMRVTAEAANDRRMSRPTRGARVRGLVCEPREKRDRALLDRPVLRVLEGHVEEPALEGVEGDVAACVDDGDRRRERQAVPGESAPRVAEGVARDWSSSTTCASESRTSSSGTCVVPASADCSASPKRARIVAVECRILSEPFGTRRMRRRTEPELEDIVGERRHGLCYSE